MRHRAGVGFASLTAKEIEASAAYGSSVFRDACMPLHDSMRWNTWRRWAGTLPGTIPGHGYFRVAFALSKLADDQGRIFASIGTLARISTEGPATVRSTLQWLKADKRIRTRRRPGKSTAIYLVAHKGMLT